LDHDPATPARIKLDPTASRRLALAMLGLIVAGLAAYALLATPPEPPPAAIAGDPTLVRGRAIFLDRCLSCHGPTGRGDGPLAKGLTGPAPRNLAEERWRHGDRPEDVLAVLANGVKDSQMPAWSGAYGPDDLKCVAAYVYHLARRPVPDALRSR